MTKQHFGASHVPLSPAVRAGDFIFVSGQVPVGPDGAVVAGGVEAQTRQVVENIEAALKLAGASLADIDQDHGNPGRRARLRRLQQGLCRIFPERSAGPDDHGGATDDRHQGRDRGDRLQAKVNRFSVSCASSPLRSPLKPTRSRRPD